MSRLIRLILLAILLSSCQPATAGQLDSAAKHCAAITQYDQYFQSATKRYLQNDWRYLKAQSCQESKIRPSARSPVGAYGFMQFMAGTWRDMQKQLKVPPLLQASAKDQIEAGAFYMGQLTASWGAKRTAPDRIKLALASYNAGIGNLLKAQKKCGGCADYAGIIVRLPEVTGAKNAKETTGYSINIFGIYDIWLRQQSR